MRYVKTTCPYCGCGCELVLEVDGDNLVGVMPAEARDGGRAALCIKGWNAWQFVQDPARARAPMIRDGSGELSEASWPEAIRATAERIADIQRRHGPDSVVFLSSAKMTNEENYAFMRLARGAFGTNNIDHCARL
jgi:predicted molibdopterin-dependent oxidoreductase YjgC